MKNKIIITFVIMMLAMGVVVTPRADAKAFKSLSFNGATGLISTPTARTGWEDSHKFCMDTGFHFIYDRDYSFIPKVTLQLFGRWELGASYDIQRDTGNDWTLAHTKVVLYRGESSAFAIGGNLQLIKLTPHDREDLYGQAYMAFTYGGNFFGLPAEATLVLGYTVGTPRIVRNYGRYGPIRGARRQINSDIDFSMGFDLDFFPQVFKHYVHWIMDFANYSYSVDPNGCDPSGRGCFNTGLRIAVLKGDQRLKLNFDFMLVDGLDSNRTFATGFAFGFGF